MLSTVLAVTFFIATIFTACALWVWFLSLGLRWAKTQHFTTRQLIEAVIAVTVLQVATVAALAWLEANAVGPPVVLWAIESTLSVLVPVVVIRHLFQIRFLRAVQAWLPTLLSSVLVSVGTLGFVRPFLYESFRIPTNSMAPTIVGRHLQGVCPECGAPTYGSPIPEHLRFASTASTRMICDNFHINTDTNVAPEVISGDRILVAKFYAARRWDLVVFQYPEYPSDNYVKRLIGLPGETVYIEDGTIFVDGKPLTPPASLANIQYQSETAHWHPTALWGSKDRPATLEEDEYFVLGDFSEQAKDSRYWQHPAPGHTNPYAVPESHMLGVVTHTLWPPQRWRVHR